MLLKIFLKILWKGCNFMKRIDYRRGLFKRLLSIIVFLSLPLLSYGAVENTGAGGVNYNMTAGELSNAVTWVLTFTVIVVEILNAIAAIVAVIGTLQVSFKFAYGEGESTKSIIMLVGGCVFLMITTMAIPVFFGFSAFEFGIVHFGIIGH